MIRGIGGWRLLPALALLMAVAGPAQAHTLSESHSLWEIRGTDVDLVMTIPVIELQRIDTSPGGPSDEVVRKYLADRIYPISDGKECKLIPPIQSLSATPGFRKYDFTFQCPSTGNLQLRSSAFFDLVPSHTNFAEIQNASTGDFAEQLITKEHQTVDVSGGETERLQSAGFFEFVGMGLMHIFTGIDHMSFLLGLVLICRRLRDLVFVVSGFTIGHSLTLALAVTGVIRPHAEYIDALVALTIVLIGAENVAEQTHRPGPVAVFLGGSLGLMALGSCFGFGDLPGLLFLGGGLFTANYLMITGALADAGKFRTLITMVFGLIHGFGFASNLLQMQLPTNRLAELLVGFNVGVEIAQLTLVLGVTALAALLTRFVLTIPRPIVVDVASSFLVGLGTYWFITRSYG
jgi:hypothetical protein